MDTAENSGIGDGLGKRADGTKAGGLRKMDIGTYTRMYADGEVIFEEGATGREAYFIVAGKAEVSQSAGGRKIAIATLQEGDFFGEMASLTGDNRSMTITAMGAVYLWKLSSEEMLQYMQSNHQFTVRICTSLAERLSHTNLIVKALVPDSSPFLRGLATRMTISSGEDQQRDVIDYLRERIKQKDKEIEALREQLDKLQEPSLFLRGSRRRHKAEDRTECPEQPE